MWLYTSALVGIVATRTALAAKIALDAQKLLKEEEVQRSAWLVVPKVIHKVFCLNRHVRGSALHGVLILRSRL